MPDPMIEAKIAQAVGILDELGIDVWMILGRETATVHDPCLDLVVGGNGTWISAWLITRRGERIAVLGSLDVPAHRALGHYPEIVSYVKGIREPLQEPVPHEPAGDVVVDSPVLVGTVPAVSRIQGIP